MRARGKLKLITLWIPEPYLKELDILVYEKYHPNRAEAIRMAVRDLIKNELPLAEERRRKRESYKR